MRVDFETVDLERLNGILITTWAGQIKFTVYRHNIFYFACGQAVIIQISNELNIIFKVPL